MERKKDTRKWQFTNVVQCLFKYLSSFPPTYLQFIRTKIFIHVPSCLPTFIKLCEILQANNATIRALPAMQTAMRLDRSSIHLKYHRWRSIDEIKPSIVSIFYILPTPPIHPKYQSDISLLYSFYSRDKKNWIDGWKLIESHEDFFLSMSTGIIAIVNIFISFFSNTL